MDLLTTRFNFVSFNVNGLPSNRNLFSLQVYVELLWPETDPRGVG